MIYKAVLINLLIAFAISTFAQKDPEAEKILKQVAEKGLAYKTVFFDFDFLVESTQNEQVEKYKGQLWLKGDKFKMSVDNTVTFCNGKSRWVYLPEAEETTVSAIEKSDDLDPEERFLLEPRSIYTLYKVGFKYHVSGSQDIDGKNYTVIDLSPEDLNRPYFKVKCWISETYDFYAVKYFQKDGTRITLQINNLKVNEKYKDALFNFNTEEYPDVELIDLRE